MESKEGKRLQEDRKAEVDPFKVNRPKTETPQKDKGETETK